MRSADIQSMTALFTSIARFYGSSIGKKIIVALTGIALVGFLLGHLLGNLTIYGDYHAINEYAHGLKSLAGGNLVWVARFGLLAAFVVHIAATIQLRLQNNEARPVAYAHSGTIQATPSSRIMIVSGLTILAFVIFHILQFTILPDTSIVDSNGMHDVHRMVVLGFSNKAISLFYIIAMALLSSHLSHGVASIFQTLGLSSDRSRPAIVAFGYTYAAVIFFGNISIPIAVMAGWVQ